MANTNDPKHVPCRCYGAPVIPIVVGKITGYRCGKCGQIWPVFTTPEYPPFTVVMPHDQRQKPQNEPENDPK
jgi:hypothetical protein